jgi:protein-tyrosine kinase
VSIIEQAARRLEELRRSGVDVTAVGTRGAPAQNGSGPARPQRGEAPSSVVRGIGSAAGGPSQAAARAPGKPSKLVQIDLAHLAAMGYLTPETPREQIADEFRVIKRPLLDNVNRQGPGAVERANLLMVTSSLPGEGKTFVSINLAMSLAMELDTTVLLVDADVSRPSVLSRLGLPQSPGLLDLLANPALEMSEVMLRTSIEKLSILPAGMPQGRATEMLASDSMDRLLDELASRYADRIIVFDAPPLLPSTESRVLATHMGQVVLVVEAEKTPQKSVTQALATIEACPVVLPLLNKISRSEVGSYYGYYGPLEG